MSGETEHGAVIDRLFEYLDGDLSDSDRAHVEQHVSDCEQCARELELTRSANLMFKEIPQAPLPQGFHKRLNERLQFAARPLVTQPLLEEAAPKPPANGAVMKAPRPVAAMTTIPAARTSPPRSFSWRPLLAVAACLVVLAGTLLLLRPPAQPLAQQSPVQLAYGNGDVLVGQVRAQQTVGLQAGDSIQTGSDSRAVVTLGASGSLRLGPNTSVRLLAFSAAADGLTATVKLVEGKIWVQEEGATHCSVETGDALLVPVGTTYEAIVQDGSSQVQVFDGKVAVTSHLPSPDHTELSAGQSAQVSVQRQQQRLGLIDASVQNDAWVQWNHRLSVAAPTQRRTALAPASENPAQTPSLSWTAAPPSAPHWQSEAVNQSSAASTPPPPSQYAGPRVRYAPEAGMPPSGSQNPRPQWTPVPRPQAPTAETGRVAQPQRYPTAAPQPQPPHEEEPRARQQPPREEAGRQPERLNESRRQWSERRPETWREQQADRQQREQRMEHERESPQWRPQQHPWPEHSAPSSSRPAPSGHHHR